MPFELDENVALAVPGPLAQETYPSSYDFEGYVDFVGYHATAEGWLFGGWIAYPWPIGDRPESIIAHFKKDAVAGDAILTFYFRADVEGRGIGYVFYLHATSSTSGDFLRIDIQFTRLVRSVLPTNDVLLLDEALLNEEVRPILITGEEGSQRRKLLDLMARGPRHAPVTGFLDFYGYHGASGGWLLCGWVAPKWRPQQRPRDVVAAFEQGDIGGDAVVARYPRPDLPEEAEGLIAFVPGSAASLGSLCALNFDLNGARATLHVSPQVRHLRELELVSRIRPLLAGGGPDDSCDAILGLLSRKPYTGEDTLAALSDPVFFEIDEAIFCEPDSLLLMGWHLAKPLSVRGIRVRCGALSTLLDERHKYVVSRPDVVTAFASQGFDDPRCGFVAFVPHCMTPGGRAYIEVETTRREVGYRGVPRSKLQGMAAVKRILESIDPRFADVPLAYGSVVGPAIEALNRNRLAVRPPIQAVDYGEVPSRPRFSVVVPLYGRLDFVEYQFALFSEHPGLGDAEFIYVLDDPPQRHEAQSLCASVFARFGVPFRLLLLERNVGFAPASNVGLAHAHGEYVVFLNSDVFPGTRDWMERLARQLEDHPDIGVIGPLLLFEDGSVQHRGLEFRRLREFGDWYFTFHEGKGLRRVEGEHLRRCIGITGACMMMRRSLALQVGGFDEVYAIGDFEDTDLCFKLHDLGYASAVDNSVHLYHLERKSQTSSATSWRLNLTIYNAWQHQRRWAASIAADEAAATSEHAS